MLFLPETPSWLAQKGRWDDVNQVLDRVVSPTEKEKEVGALRSSLAVKKHASVRELFGPGLRIALVVGLGLAVFQQAVGTGAISYYAPTIFRYAGFHKEKIWRISSHTGKMGNIGNSPFSFSSWFCTEDSSISKRWSMVCCMCNRLAMDSMKRVVKVYAYLGDFPCSALSLPS